MNYYYLLLVFFLISIIEKLKNVGSINIDVRDQRFFDTALWGLQIIITPLHHIFIATGHGYTP